MFALVNVPFCIVFEMQTVFQLIQPFLIFPKKSSSFVTTRYVRCEADSTHSNPHKDSTIELKSPLDTNRQKLKKTLDDLTQEKHFHHESIQRPIRTCPSLKLLTTFLLNLFGRIAKILTESNRKMLRITVAH